MAATIQLKGNTWTQMLSTELNALASATAVLQVTGTNPAFDNSAAVGGLWLWADFELDVTFASSPTAGKTVDLYLISLAQAGGTTYWDASITAVPTTLYIGSFPVRAVSTAQLIGFRSVPLPPQPLILLLNNGTDQAFPATGSKVYMNTYGLQSV